MYGTGKVYGMVLMGCLGIDNMKRVSLVNELWWQLRLAMHQTITLILIFIVIEDSCHSSSHRDIII